MRRLEWVGFAAFCLLSGSRWLVEEALPSNLPRFEQESLHYALTGVMAAAVWLLVRRMSAGPKSTPWPGLAAAGVLLLGLPALLIETARSVTPETAAGLFALVPLFVVVGAAAFTPARGRALMMPALIGFGGAVLLLRFQLPSTVHSSFHFAMAFVAVLLTAAGSLWMHALLRGRDILPALVAVCGVNALLLGVAAGVRGAVLPSASSLPLELLRWAALDLPQLFLLVWLLREVPPARLASRYLLVPLLATVEGILFLRPSLDWRIGLGLLLLAGGTAALLFWNEADASDTPSPLGLR